jgi:hypothetical protein
MLTVGFCVDNRTDISELSVTRAAPKSDLDPQIHAEQISFLHRLTPFTHLKSMIDSKLVLFILWCGNHETLNRRLRNLKWGGRMGGAIGLARNVSVFDRPRNCLDCVGREVAA